MTGAAEKHRQSLVETVDRLAPFWSQMALRIHAHPELALEEKKASTWLAQTLEEAGFAVTRGVAELPTSFVAARHAGSSGPVVAFVAEYDALPRLGHACGHNLIGAAACLAGQALAEVAESEVRVIGAPAEESYGGKGQMVEHGVFADVDFAMMAHGGFMNLPSRQMLGCKAVTVEFRRVAGSGQGGNPDADPLDAMIMTFNAVAVLRAQLRDGARIRGVITYGGDAANIVPEHTNARFLVRSREADYLDELEQRLKSSARTAAEATGTAVEFATVRPCMQLMKRNPALEAAYERNLGFLGQEVGRFPPDEPIGSTDFGNVSQVVPGIHAYFKMVPREVKHHTAAYSEASRSEAGLAGMVMAAKTMALTGLDLAEDADLQARVREDFRRAPR